MKLLKLLLSVIFLYIFFPVEEVCSQQVPGIPVSYRIFTPFIFNPAIAGSKDFSSLDLLISNYGKSNAQLLGLNQRLPKSGKHYFSSPSVREFTNFGIGGYLSNATDSISRNRVVGGTASYHIRLDKEALSYLSFGVTGKAIFNKYRGSPDYIIPEKETTITNIDAGIYYYSPRFYAGISATNLLDNTPETDTASMYSIPVSRQFFLNAGFKFVISKAKNILIEPFIIINDNDSTSGELKNMLKPGLTLYASNFRIGTYFNDFNKLSFFGQYKYSRAYVGAYFEFPYKSAFYNNPLIAELAMGLNLSTLKKRSAARNHW